MTSSRPGRTLGGFSPGSRRLPVSDSLDTVVDSRHALQSTLSKDGKVIAGSGDRLVEFPLKASLLKFVPAAAVMPLALYIFAGSVLRYVSGPNPAKTWNEKALVVSDVPRFDLYGEKDPVIALAYNVKNMTNSDYSIETPPLKIVAVTPDGVLSNPIVSQFVEVQTPVFIPASHIGMVVLHLKGLHAPDRNQSESDEVYHERLRQQIMKELLSHQVDGFVLFDDVNRYQINLPVWATTKHGKSGGSSVVLQP